MALRSIAAVLCLLAPAPVLPGAELTGFTPASRDEEARFEKVFADTPTPSNARKWLAALTEDPHVAGTPAEKRLADYVHDRFREFGLGTEIVRYEVFLNHPKHTSLKLIEPVEAPLSLREEVFDVDKDSSRYGVFPAFHGYGASGDSGTELRNDGAAGMAGQNGGSHPGPGEASHALLRLLCQSRARRSRL